MQAGVGLELDRATRTEESRRGVEPERQGLGVARQVGLATRTSPHAARGFLGAATVWHTEMPHTYRALAEGRLSPHRATILVRETACLALEDRARVDEELCADPRTLDGVGTRRLTAMVRARAAQLDPAAVVARHARAESQAGVWVRPAPEGMAYLTALVPLRQGVSVYAHLKAAADAATAAGDERGRGRVMADTLVERVTG